MGHGSGQHRSHRGHRWVNARTERGRLYRRRERLWAACVAMEREGQGLKLKTLLPTDVVAQEAPI